VPIESGSREAKKSARNIAHDNTDDIITSGLNIDTLDRRGVSRRNIDRAAMIGRTSVLSFEIGPSIQRTANTRNRVIAESIYVEMFLFASEFSIALGRHTRHENSRCDLSKTLEDAIANCPRNETKREREREREREQRKIVAEVSACLGFFRQALCPATGKVPLFVLPQEPWPLACPIRRRFQDSRSITSDRRE